MDEFPYWLALASLPGLRPMTMAAAVVRFGGAEAAWRQKVELLIGDEELSEAELRSLAAAKNDTDPGRLMESVQKSGCRVITWADEDYPKGLLRLYEPPPVIYVLGDKLPVRDRTAAIVGTRTADRGGERFATRLARELAGRGVAVVSGLARGIDGAAHLGALTGGGPTVAVLGSGIDVVYPPEHGRLYHRVRESGAVISEYPPGTPPAQDQFPWRNRIIAGLSGAVVVVQAGRHSGALITARYAEAVGAEILAVPGDPDRARSAGSNRLLRDGAHVVLDVFDVLCALQWKGMRSRRRAWAGDGNPEGNTMAASLGPAGELSEAEKKVYSVLSEQPLPIDTIAQRAGVPAGTACAALLTLELKGLAEAVPGSAYVRGECGNDSG